jgi:hypothetical protein
MNWKERLDNFWIGLLIGILFPGLLFFIYWLYFHNQLSFPGRFIEYLIGGNLLSNVLKLCGLGNLLLFYFGLTKKMDRFSKGIILSVFLYIGLIAYITYYHEKTLI